MRRAALLLVSALLLTSCGTSSPSSRPLADTLAGMPPTAFSSVTLHEGVLVFHTTQRHGHRYLFRAEWEARLVSYALGERQRDAGKETVRFYQFAGPAHRDLVGQEVSPRGFTGPRFHGARLRPPGLWQDADLVIKQQVRTAAGRCGFAVQGVQVLRPLGPAIVVRVTVPRGRPACDLDQLIGPMFPRGIDGWLLELDSPRGRPLVLAAKAARSRVGSDWFVRGQDDRFGITTLGLPPRLMRDARTHRHH